MKNKSQQYNVQVIEAAGGIVWRETPQGTEVAIVHRPGHEDWSIPKGKRDPEEKWHETALREVLEETGCTVEITGFAGSISYPIYGAIKLVLFWNMSLIKEGKFTPNLEIDNLKWLNPREALNWLTYQKEIALLKDQISTV